MSFFKTAYETTVGSAFATNKIVHAIKEVLVIAPYVQLVPAKLNQEDRQPILAAITGRTTYEGSVPSFTHPLLMEGMDKKKYLFIDIRSYVKPGVGEGSEFIVRNHSEYKLARARIAMAKVWLTQGPAALSGISVMPMQVFASWISQGISHRFVLSPMEQLQMAIIAAFYYQSLFVEESEFDEETRDQFNANCIRGLKAPAKIVFETTAKIGKLANIMDFCTAVQTILENPRLGEFNAGLMISVLKGTWFGTNAAELLGVSLEYPPTWVALVYSSMSDRTYRNSNLMRLTEMYSKGGAENYFTRGFVALAQGATQDDASEDSF